MASKKQAVYRQGDVWIYEISRDEYRQRIGVERGVVGNTNSGLILAEGEATGHHHKILSTKVRLRPRPGTRNQVRLLSVRDETVSLVHEEHEPIAIPPGHYEVRIQREYEPSAPQQSRRVYD